MIEDVFDELYVDPEVQDFIDFMENDEQDSTGFLTKKSIEANREGWERI